MTNTALYPWEALRGDTRLEYLNLDGVTVSNRTPGTQVDAAFVTAVAALPALTWLSLEKLRYIEPVGRTFAALTLPAFTAPLPKLRYLALNGTPMTPDYQALGRSDSLIEVELRGAVAATSDGTLGVGSVLDPLAGTAVLDDRQYSNSKLGTVSETGPWAGGANAGAFGGDYRILPATAAGSVVYHLDLSQTLAAETQYDVYATWPAGAAHTDRAVYAVSPSRPPVVAPVVPANATFTAGQTSEPAADLTLGGRPWQRLGIVKLPAGYAYGVQVVVTNAGVGSLVADGIRLVRRAPADGGGFTRPLPKLKLVDVRGNATLGNEFFDYAQVALTTTLGAGVANGVGTGGGVWYDANPAPAFPAAGIGTVSVVFNGTPVTIPLGVTDTVGGPLAYTVAADARLFAAPSVTGGVLTLTPLAGAAGNSTVTVRASDGGRVTTQTFDVRLGRSSASTLDTGNPAGDQLVNTTVAGSQTLPETAVAADGRSVTVWQQYNPAGGIDVLFQRYDKFGKPLDGETFANLTPNTASVRERPDVSMADDGSFVVVWHAYESTGTGYDVYARRFAADGSAPAGPVLVTTTNPANDQFYPRVATAPHGRGSVVTWFELVGFGNDQADYDVFAQRLTAAGTLAGDRIAVSTFAGQEESYPDVAVDAAGNFTVAYNAADAPFSLGVFARRGSLATGTLSAPVAVSGSPTAGSQTSARVAYNRLGESVVAWVDDGRGHGQDVLARRYAADGTPGPLVSVDESANDQTLPAVGLDDDGVATVAYQSYSPAGNNDVLTRRLGRSGWSTPATQINQANPVSQGVASVAVRPSGDVVVAWASVQQDNGSENADGVYRRQYHFDGLLRPTDREQVVNTNQTAGNQQYPAAASSPNGRTYTVWQSDNLTAGGYDVYLQVTGADGSPITPPVKVATSPYYEARPAVAAIDDRLVVAWVGGNGVDIYATRYPIDLATGVPGNPSDPVLVNAAATPGSQTRPVVTMNVTGRYAIAWQSDNDGTTAVWAARFDGVGAPLAGEAGGFEVARSFDPNGGPLVSNLGRPAIALDTTGNLVVAWQADNYQTGTGTDVYVRRVAAAPGSIASALPAVRANTVATFTAQQDPAVAALPSGEFLLAWADQSQNAVVTRRLNADGTFTGQDPEVVVSVYAGVRLYSPSLAVDAAGRYAVAWQSGYTSFEPTGGQNGGVTGVVFRRFAADGTPVAVGPEQLLGSNPGYLQVEPKLVYSGNTLVGVWATHGLDATNTYGVFARRFEPDGRVTVARRDVQDQPVEGATAYLDLNGNGTLDPADRLGVTGADGVMTFADVPGGLVTVRELVPQAPPAAATAGGTVTVFLDDGSRPAVTLTGSPVGTLADQTVNEGAQVTHTPTLTVTPTGYAWAVTRLGDPGTLIASGTGPTFTWTVPDDGTYRVTLTVTYGGGTQAVIYGRVYGRNVPIALTLADETRVEDEGTTLLVPAGVTDPADLPRLRYDWTVTHGTDQPVTWGGIGTGYATYSQPFPHDDAVPTVLAVRAFDPADPDVVLARTVSVTVRDKPAVPSLGQTPSSAQYEGDTWGFMGSYVDPDPTDDHAESWQVLDAGGAEVAHGTGRQFTFVPRDNGHFTARYTVGNPGPTTATASYPFVAANAAPVVTGWAGPTTLTEEQPGTWALTFTDRGAADTHAVAWQVRDAGGTVVASGGGAATAGTPFTFDWTPAYSGSYTVRATVTDDDGAAVTPADKLLAVSNLRSRQVTAAGGATPEGAPLTLTSGYRDPADGSTVLARWTVTDAGGAVVAALDGLSPSFAPPDNGTYTATLTLTNAGTGLSSTAVTMVTATNRPPTGVFAPPAYLPAGEPYLFAVTGATDPGSADVAAGLHFAFDWNGDGTFEVGDGTYAGSPADPTAGVSLPAGTRTVTARVIDTDGAFTDYSSPVTLVARPTVAGCR